MTMRQDKAIQMLLDLGNPAERRTRTQLLDQALRTTLALTEADAAVILTPWSRRGDRMVLHSGSGSPATALLSTKPSVVAQEMAENCQPLMLLDLSEDSRIAEADACPGVDPGPTLFTPVRQRNFSPAYIASYRRRGRGRFTATDARVMVLFGSWLGAALDHLRLATGTERLSVTDELTDVYNYRFIKSALNREIRRASRFGHDLSLAIVAVDELESYTGEHGELRANLLQKEVAAILAQQVRSFDVLGRYADDSFMLILPQTDRGGATVVADRMRAAVEKTAVSSNAAGKITVSLGVASFPTDGADLNDLLSTTERALTEARQRGPNSVATLDRKAA